MKLRTLQSLRSLVLAGSLALLWAGSAAAEERVYSIDRVVRSGDSVNIDVPDRAIRRVDVLVKRMNADNKDCHLTAGYKNESSFDGKGAQVDRQDYHEVVILANGERSRDRDLQIRVHNGDVNIREVIVHFD